MAPRLLLMALMLLVFLNLSFASKLVRFEGNLDNSVHVVGNLDKSVETGSGAPISQGIGTSGVRFESNFDKTVELVGNLDKSLGTGSGAATSQGIATSGIKWLKKKKVT